jgi:hypothetical protein
MAAMSISRSPGVKKTHVKSSILVGMGAALAARTVAKLVREIGQLSDEVDRGYTSANALPVAGQAGFPDTSGVRPAGTAITLRPSLRWTAAIV